MTDTSSAPSLAVGSPLPGGIIASTLDAIEVPPPKPGWKTTEFWLGLAAKLLGGAYAAGFIGDGTTVSRIAGLAVVVLAYLGYTVSRGMVKAAAAMLLVSAIAGGTSTQAGCMKADTIAKNAKGAIVDCIHADQAAIELLLVQLATDATEQALHVAAVNWLALEDEAETQGLIVGGCAYALFVHGHTAGGSTAVASSSSVATTPADPAIASLERLRARSGGVRWSTSLGQL